VQPKRNSLEEARARVLAKSKAISRFLGSPDGKEVLSLLEEEFFLGSMMGSSPEQTAFNLGRRDVVVYIRNLRDFAQKEIPNVDPFT
jgi:hypothetical protein